MLQVRGVKEFQELRFSHPVYVGIAKPGIDVKKTG